MRILAFSLLLTLPSFSATPADIDRQRLIAHFEMTESWIVDEVIHLSPAQLKFRAAPASWNVLDCVEHLVLSEPHYWDKLKSVMAEKPTKKESPSEDVTRLWYGIDRTGHEKTVESQVPNARFTEAAPALAGFRKLRATMLEYVRTSNEDWRHHLVPGWNRDAYQWLLMISAHSQRHILQLREIKHDPNFPKN